MPKAGALTPHSNGRVKDEALSRALARGVACYGDSGVRGLTLRRSRRVRDQLSEGVSARSALPLGDHATPQPLTAYCRSHCAPASYWHRVRLLARRHRARMDKGLDRAGLCRRIGLDGNAVELDCRLVAVACVLLSRASRSAAGSGHCMGSRWSGCATFSVGSRVK